MYGKTFYEPIKSINDNIFQVLQKMPIQIEKCLKEKLLDYIWVLTGLPKGHILYVYSNVLSASRYFYTYIAARSEVELQGIQVEQSEASSVSFSLDDDPEGLEDSTWSYDTNIKDLDDFVSQIPGSRQADKELRLVD